MRMCPYRDEDDHGSQLAINGEFEDVDGATESDEVTTAAVQQITADQIKTEQGFGDELCGGGGCIAYALWKLGVFKSQKTAMATLNACAERLYQGKLHQDKDYPRNKVYIKDLTWCPEAVQNAVQSVQFMMKKILTNDDIVQHRMPVNLQEMISEPDNRLLMEGTLGSEYFDIKTGSMVQTDPDDPTSSEEDPDAWCHTIGIRNGKILDTFHPNGLSVDHLRLSGNDLQPLEDTDGQVLRASYMHRISKVWILTRPQRRVNKHKTANTGGAPAKKRRTVSSKTS